MADKSVTGDPSRLRYRKLIRRFKGSMSEKTWFPQLILSRSKSVRAPIGAPSVKSGLLKKSSFKPVKFWIPSTELTCSWQSSLLMSLTKLAPFACSETHALNPSSAINSSALSSSSAWRLESFGYASALSPTPSPSESTDSEGSLGNSSSPSATPSLSSSLSSVSPVVESLAPNPWFQSSGWPSLSRSTDAAMSSGKSSFSLTMPSPSWSSPQIPSQIILAAELTKFPSSEQSRVLPLREILAPF